MAESVGLDVSMKETAVSIRRDGKRIWRGTCGSDPKLVAEVIRRRAPDAARVVFETGPLSVWFFHALTAKGCRRSALMRAMPRRLSTWPPTRRMRTMPMVWRSSPRSGSFVRCGSRASTACLRTLVAARNRLVQITTELSNQIRGLMKTFGLLVPAGKGSKFEEHVRGLLEDQAELARIILPVLEAWRGLRRQAAELSRQLIVSARQSQACQILMSIPGVGAITATSFATAIEDPGNFRKSRSVGAWLGLTTRRYQSGEVDYDGHISRRGDTHLRGLLYEAATVLLTRTSAESSLRHGGSSSRRSASRRGRSRPKARGRDARHAAVWPALRANGWRGSLRPVLMQGVHSRTPN